MEQQQRKTLFTTRSLILLMLPIIGENLLSQLVGVVDGIMVSSVGEVAISAVSLVANVSTVIINLLIALATGGSIVTSQLIGAEKHTDAKRSTGQVITMTFLVGTVLALICLLLNRNILRLFFGKVETAVLDDSVTYFFYDALSYPFLSLCAAGGAVMRSRGNSKTMFYVSILRNIVNIVGNAICIYVLKMGVAGVAIPTALSRVVGAAVLMILVMKKDHPLRPASSDIFHINHKLMSKMLRIGIPNAIEGSIFQFGKLLTLGMISGFSTIHIAANSTSGAIFGLVVTISAGIRTGAMNVIGQCVGTQDEDQLRTNARKVHSMSYLLFGVVSCLIFVLRRQVVSLYTGLSPEAAALTRNLLAIYLLSGIVFYIPSFTTPALLRAANDGTFVMWVSIISMMTFRLSLAWILCVHLAWGAPGVIIATVIDWVSRSIFFTWRWNRGGWKAKCNLGKR